MLRPLCRLLERQPIFCLSIRLSCTSALKFALGWLCALWLALILGWSAPGKSAPANLSTNFVSTSFSTANFSTANFSTKPATQLPPPAVHPLPPFLAQWQDSEQQGDYFDAIEPTAAGYLVWSTFPVRVYIQPPDAADITGRTQAWSEAVQQALQEWAVYLPLTLTPDSATADISIWRAAPPLQPLAPQTEPNQPLIDRLPRVRAAETRYEIFVSAPQSILSHRYTIHLSPNQTSSYTLATARHELGHALGIWGHSPLPTDALYFSQVRHSPPISHRDINTLKRIYEQPTRLGWELR